MLALATLGAGVALSEWPNRTDVGPEPTPLVLGVPGAPLSDPEQAARPDLPPDFVPDLPAVPTLPPGTHIGGRQEPDDDDTDPMARLAIEMRLVREAQRLVPIEPREALVLLDRHRRTFPEGALREEREAYAIEALAALGRHDEVERRLLDFRSDHPYSSFLDRLERVTRAGAP